MPGKAQFKFMLAAQKGKSDPGDSNDEKDFGRTAKKKKGKGSLQDAAKRRLQKMSNGKKNGNN